MKQPTFEDYLEYKDFLLAVEKKATSVTQEDLDTLSSLLERYIPNTAVTITLKEKEKHEEMVG